MPTYQTKMDSLLQSKYKRWEKGNAMAVKYSNGAGGGGSNGYNVHYEGEEMSTGGTTLVPGAIWTRPVIPQGLGNRTVSVYEFCRDVYCASCGEKQFIIATKKREFDFRRFVDMYQQHDPDVEEVIAVFVDFTKTPNGFPVPHVAFFDIKNQRCSRCNKNVAKIVGDVFVLDIREPVEKRTAYYIEKNISSISNKYDIGDDYYAKTPININNMDPMDVNLVTSTTSTAGSAMASQVDADLSHLYGL